MAQKRRSTRKGKRQPKLAERLTLKQQLFAEEFIVDWNGAAAARKAGYSERTAKQTAHKLLQDPRVQKAIDAAVKARRDRLRLNQDRAVLELAPIAFAKLTDFVKWGPDHVTLIDSDTLTPEQAAAVAEVGEVISKNGERAYRLKLHPKLQALQQLTQMLGLDKPEAKKEFSWSDLVRMAEEDAAREDAGEP